MLTLGSVTKDKVLFLVLVFVFNFDLFKFSAAILEKGLLSSLVNGTDQNGFDQGQISPWNILMLHHTGHDMRIYELITARKLFQQFTYNFTERNV